jgi:dGTPase
VDTKSSQTDMVSEADREAEAAVVELLRALVEHYAANPRLLPPSRLRDLGSSTPEAFREAVTYVGGMTDRFACERGVELLAWPLDELPVGFDVRR